MKIKKSSLLIAAVVVSSIFVYYRYTKEVLQSGKEQASTMVVRDESVNTPGLKEVSAEVTYDTPGDYPDHLRFVVALDGEGTIQSIQTFDAETGEVPEKKKEFTEQINVLLKGKKLSELSAIDKVGKSSLTTDAFNQALGDLKAKL